MKRQSTASALKTGTRDGTRSSRGATVHGRTSPERDEPREAVSLESVPARSHTLVLTGELNHRSARDLEAAIDRLCEERVTGITLDLRQLRYIDSIGVAVIAFRAHLCQRRGYDFSLVPGSRLVNRAFEQAGVIDLLPFRSDEAVEADLPEVAAGP